MKKNIKRLTISLIILTLIFIIFCIKPTKAAVTTTLKASSASVSSGGTFSVTVTSSTKLSGWTISLSSNGGCTFSNASGGEVSGSTVYGTNLNGTTSLATYTFKAPTISKDTTYKITFSGSNMCDATDDVNEVNNTSCTATITVKAKTTTSSSSSNSSSSGSSSNSGSTNSSSSSNKTTTTKTPTFTSVNKTVYTTGSCNLRSSWSTSSTATSVAEGTELKLTGTSTETINGYVWYRVTYNGTTKYIASSLITETKPKEDDKSSNKNLSSLSIEGIELTPKFDKETTQYTAKVGGDVTELKIDAKAEDSKAKVTIEGNEGLKEGDNIIKVKVTAEDNTTRTYFITVTVGEGTETDNKLKLSDLTIAKVDFDGVFNPDTYTYKLSLNTYVDKLDITAIPNQADATVEITGNSDFITGTNTVTILLTSADGTQTATYQIQVEISEEIAEESSEPNMAIYIIIGVVIAVAVILIILFIIRYRTTKKEIIEDEDEISENEIISEYNTNNEEKEDNNEEEKNTTKNKKQNKQKEEITSEQKEEIEKITEEKKNSKKKKSDVTLDDFLNVPDENQEKPKKSKGRHSI